MYLVFIYVRGERGVGRKEREARAGKKERRRGGGREGGRKKEDHRKTNGFKTYEVKSHSLKEKMCVLFLIRGI